MTLPHWMSIAGLPWHYSAVQLHLHWGREVGVATGSEHTINGQSTAAEVCACVVACIIQRFLSSFSDLCEQGLF